MGGVQRRVRGFAPAPRRCVRLGQPAEAFASNALLGQTTEALANRLLNALLGQAAEASDRAPQANDEGPTQLASDRAKGRRWGRQCWPEGRQCWPEAAHAGNSSRKVRGVPYSLTFRLVILAGQPALRGWN